MQFLIVYFDCFFLFFDADPASGSRGGKILIRDPGWIKFDPGSGMAKNLDPGSGINISDPQHW
jgi:hypothetical protein